MTRCVRAERRGDRGALRLRDDREERVREACGGRADRVLHAALRAEPLRERAGEQLEPRGARGRRDCGQQVRRAGRWSSAHAACPLMTSSVTPSPCSFEAYSDRLMSAAERSANALVGVLPFLTETPLRSSLAKTHDEFVQYEAAFNDLRCVARCAGGRTLLRGARAHASSSSSSSASSSSLSLLLFGSTAQLRTSVHVFPAARVLEAVENAALADLMAAISAAGGPVQDGELIAAARHL